MLTSAEVIEWPGRTTSCMRHQRRSGHRNPLPHPLTWALYRSFFLSYCLAVPYLETGFTLGLTQVDPDRRMQEMEEVWCRSRNSEKQQPTRE